ncbi:MAG: hypothetical protein QM703_18430 [Gemmatales bacterium]
MSISMLVEKAANGYRAVAGGPFELSAEAVSAEAAIAALRTRSMISSMAALSLLNSLFHNKIFLYLSSLCLKIPCSMNGCKLLKIIEIR